VILEHTVSHRSVLEKGLCRVRKLHTRKKERKKKPKKTEEQGEWRRPQDSRSGSKIGTGERNKQALGTTTGVDVQRERGMAARSHNSWLDSSPLSIGV
jgi:hypothetical protein